FPDLRSEKIDILFGVSIEGPSELVRRRLVDTSYVLCASPAYLKKHGQPKSPQELIKHHYIAHSERKPFDIIRLNNGNELNLTPYLQLNDTMAMKECALDGLGIIYVHDYVVREEIHQKKLVPLLTKYTH